MSKNIKIKQDSLQDRLSADLTKGMLALREDLRGKYKKELAEYNKPLWFVHSFVWDSLSLTGRIEVLKNMKDKPI